MIKAPIGHPVHYFLRTRLNETREGLSRSLISALYDNGRIFNKRYTYVDFYEMIVLTIVPLKRFTEAAEAVQ